MLVRADVKCYFCGHAAGWVEGEYATLSRNHLFHPNTELDKRTIRANGKMRCARCDGPVFFEGTEPLRIRHRVEVTAADFADPTFTTKKAS